MKLVLHPLACEEIDEAVDHYLEISPRLAQRFRDQLDAAVRSVVAAPSRWAFYEPLALHQRWRRYKVDGFPFLVVYEEVAEGVRVVAVPHVSRRPGYWIGRE